MPRSSPDLQRVAKAPVRDCACHARLEHEETWRLAMTTRSTALTAPKAADGEPALKYVHANGLRFAYLEQGSGPLVMFLHGFPDNAWSYRVQMQAFAHAGHRAVSPFLRGYAPTGDHRDPDWWSSVSRQTCAGPHAISQPEMRSNLPASFLTAP